MSDNGTYRSSLLYGVLSFAATAGLGVVTSIAVARVFGINIIGAYALVLAPTSAMWFLSSAREQAGLVRELSSLPRRSPRVTGLFFAVLAFSSTLTLVMAGLVMTVVYFVYAGPVGHPELFAPALVTMAAYVVLQNTSWNYDMVFSAYRAGRELFGVRLSATVSYLVFALGLGVVWTSLWALVVATIASQAIAVVHRVHKARSFMRYRTSRVVLRDGFRTLPDMIRFGIKLTPGLIANGISGESATWLLGALTTVSTVGAYNRAWTLGTRLRDVNFRIQEVLFPTLVERREAGDRTGFDRALIDSVRYQAGAMLLVAAVGGGAAHGVMGVFGAGFGQAADALALILLVPVISGVVSILSASLWAVDRTFITSIMAITAMVVSVSLMVVLTETVGITGTALAVVAGACINGGWNYLMARQHMHSRLLELWSARQILGQIAAYAGGFAVARVVDLAATGAVGLVLSLIAGGLVYVAVLVGVGGLNARDRHRLERVLEKLGPRLGRRRPPWPAEEGLDRSPGAGRSVRGLRSLRIPRPPLPLTLAMAGLLLIAALSGVLVGRAPTIAVGAALGLAFAALLLSSLIAGVCAFAVIQFLGVLPFATGQQVTLLKVAGGVLFLTWIATLTSRSERQRAAGLLSAQPALVAFVILYLAWGLLSSRWALSASATYSDLLRYGLNVMLLAIVYTAVRGPRQARMLAAALALGGALAASAAMAVGQSTASPAGRLGGKVAQANELAAQLIPCLLLALALAATVRAPRFRWLFGAAAALCGIGVVLSLSRGGIIAMAVALVVLCLFGGRWRERLAVALVAVAGLGLFTYYVVAPPANRGRISSSDSSGRTDIWTVGLRAFRAEPIVGHGLGNYQKVAPHFVVQPGLIQRSDYTLTKPLVAHNVFLQQLVETGIVGLVLFSAILLLSIAAMARAAIRFRDNGDESMEMMARALFASMCGYLVASFFISSQYEKTLWIVLGLGPALLTIAQAQSRPRPARARDLAPLPAEPVLVGAGAPPGALAWGESALELAEPDAVAPPLLVSGNGHGTPNHGTPNSKGTAEWWDALPVAGPEAPAARHGAHTAPPAAVPEPPPPSQGPSERDGGRSGPPPPPPPVPAAPPPPTPSRTPPLEPAPAIYEPEPERRRHVSAPPPVERRRSPAPAPGPERRRRVAGAPRLERRRQAGDALRADDARRLALRAQGLLGALDRRAGVPELLRALGGVQLDSISVLARSHELVPQSRLGPLEAEVIERAYWGSPARAFEFPDHGACILPLEMWPLFAAARRPARAAMPGSGRQPRVRRAILRRLQDGGAQTSIDLGAACRRDGVSDPAELRRGIQDLWACGLIVCAERRGWRRVYDLAERVVPSALLGEEPDEAECARRLIAHAGARLGVATASDLAAHHRLRRAEVEQRVAESGLVAVTVEGWDAEAWIHPAALSALGVRGRHRTTLLSPFDSLLWDRPRVKRIFGFDHRVEAYVSRAERRFGYFGMPLLTGGRLAGQVDPERDGEVLTLRRVEVTPSAVESMAGAVAEAARWAACAEVRVGAGVPRELRGPLGAALDRHMADR